MKLRELLLQFIPSKEIKARLSSGQIKINNEVVKDNIDILLNPKTILVDNEEHPSVPFLSLGDFMYYNSHLPTSLCTIVNFRNFFGEGETNVKDLEFLSGFTLLTLSKKEEYVFITN